MVGMVHGPAPRLLSGHRAVPDRACGAGQVGKSAAPRGASSNLSHRAACHHAGRPSCPLGIPSTLQIIGATITDKTGLQAPKRRRSMRYRSNHVENSCCSGINPAPASRFPQQLRTKQPLRRQNDAGAREIEGNPYEISLQAPRNRRHTLGAAFCVTSSTNLDVSEFDVRAADTLG